MQPPSVNCIYDDGTVLYAESANACPLSNGDAALIDATTIETHIEVTTDPPPAASSAAWWIAAAALVFLLVKKPR